MDYAYFEMCMRNLRLGPGLKTMDYPDLEVCMCDTFRTGTDFKTKN